MNRCRSGFGNVLLLLFFAIAVAGCAAGPEPADPIEAKISDYDQLRSLVKNSIHEAEAKGQKDVYIHLQEDPDTVQPADLVRADYTVTDPDGKIVYSSRADDYKRIASPYDTLFARAPEATGTETILAGFAGLFPGSGQAVLGLKTGAHRTVTVFPNKAFGPSDPDKIEKYRRERQLPRTVYLAIKTFVDRFDEVPEKGKIVRLSPYFFSRVTAVDENRVELENMVTGGETIEDEFGTTRLEVENDQITVTLTPTIGAAFKTEKRSGTIRGMDDQVFYVDYNHPLAGKPLMFDVTVVELEKYSQFEAITIPWMEDFNAAMEAAEIDGKPILMVLYAHWCQWSQRLLNTSLIDPRVKRYSDRFVWLKIDSAEETFYKEIFEQTGYPMVVLMDCHGEVLRKLNGFQDGGTLALALQNVLKDGDGFSKAANAAGAGDASEKTKLSN